jgi:hypothetical protein
LGKIIHKAQEVPFPENSPLKTTLTQADYEDAFARFIPELSEEDTAEKLLQRMSTEFPSFVLRAKKFKEMLFSPLGFSPVGLEQFRWMDLGRDDRVGIFTNKPFTAHIGLSIDRKRKKVVLSSRVVFHNFIGRGYMALIKPAHRTVFKFLLNRL